ncbi:MAG: sulfatase-like hydrolase/transferase [Spirochaetota bacterium]
MSDQRPNIVLITTDQQRFDTIGIHGNPFIDTPHLDWLCEEGVSYRNAYADCPICMPSRATIMTGKAGSTLGITGNKTEDYPLARERTMPELLGEAGYQTRAQGKMHFHPVRAHYGFQTIELPMDYYRERHRLSAGAASRPKEHGVGENEMYAVISTVHENESLTHWTVERSTDVLETRDPTRPFFLWTSFTKPHPPYDPPANYWSLYANRTVPEPVIGEWSQQADAMPQAALEPTYLLNNVHRMSGEQLANARRAYYACITHIDYSLGLLFARMRELGLMENTWIVFTSDHGDNLGDHHMGAKSNFFEGSAHVPFIVRPPAPAWEPKPLGGRAVETPVSLADIMPTILEIAGLTPHEGLAIDGTNVLRFLESPEPERLIVGESGDFLGVIGERFKYHYFVRGGTELLFDRAEDPGERRDLAADPGYAELVVSMRRRLVDELSHRGRPCVAGGTLARKPPLEGPGDVVRWPGFHSTVEQSDVLH